MPGEKIPTSGGEAGESKEVLEQQKDYLMSADTEIMEEAAKELFGDADKAYEYYDMSAGDLGALYDKVKEMTDSGADEAGTTAEDSEDSSSAEEGGDDSSDEAAGDDVSDEATDEASADGDTGDGSEPEGEPAEGDDEFEDSDIDEFEDAPDAETEDKKELTPEKKKKLGEFTATRAALIGALGGMAIIYLLTQLGNKLFGPKDNVDEKALNDLNNAPGIASTADTAVDAVEDAIETAESEHVFGERYEDINAVATTHNHYANEDGTGYNTEKNKDVCFDVSYELTGDEEQEKDQICERLVQTETLGAYYTYFGYKAEQAGVDNYGVEGVSFKNANDAIEQMNNDPDKKQDVYDYLYDLFQSSDTHVTEEKRTGDYSNFYMSADFSQGDLDESHAIEVVGCDTHEENTDVFNVQLELTSSTGSIIEFDGDLKVICIQPLDEQGGFTDGYEQIDETPTGMGLDVRTPDTPTENPPTELTPPEEETPPDETPPEEETPPDDSKKTEYENGGEHADQQDAGEVTDKPDTQNNYNPDTTNDGSTGGEDENTESETGKTVKENVDNADTTADREYTTEQTQDEKDQAEANQTEKDKRENIDNGSTSNYNNFEDLWNAE